MQKWQEKERKDAEAFKGRVTPKSGGHWSFPGDVVTEKFLIDSKATEKKGFRITGNIWRKVFNEALKSRKIPILSLSLINEAIDLVILDKNDFIELIKKDGDKNGKEK